MGTSEKEQGDGVLGSAGGSWGRVGVSAEYNNTDRGYGTALRVLSTAEGGVNGGYGVAQQSNSTSTINYFDSRVGIGTRSPDGSVKLYVRGPIPPPGSTTYGTTTTIVAEAISGNIAVLADAYGSSNVRKGTAIQAITNIGTGVDILVNGVGLGIRQRGVQAVNAFDGNLKLHKLQQGREIPTNQNSAYVCVDFSGVLFRSLTPCVQ